MSHPAPTPSATDETDSLDGWERALLDRQLEALGRLADMGMAIAAAVERRATAEEPEAEAALRNAPLDFARVSRAVRMTFALQSRLIAEFKGAARPGKASANDDDAGFDGVWGRPDIVDNDEVQRRVLKGVVGRMAEAAALDGEAVERLVREAGERIEDERLYDDLTTRPVGEMVALICQDLGLQPDWDHVADEYWARDEINRPRRGSPYAGWKTRQAQPPAVPSG